MFAGIPLPPAGNLNLTCMSIFMINSCMRITEIDNYKNYDNPTNAELDKEMSQADDMYWKKKEKEMEFGGLPHPYSKPYHFVSSFRGKVSGQGPLSGKILNKVPNSHSDWIKHGFQKSKRPDFEGSTTYYINATVLKHLVDTNKL
jgi:hypothetical protein